MKSKPIDLHSISNQLAEFQIPILNAFQDICWTFKMSIFQRAINQKKMELVEKFINSFT